MIAMAAVLSPNPQKPPFFVDFPVRHVRGELLPEDEVYERWRAALPLAQLPAHRANLLRLRAIITGARTSSHTSSRPRPISPSWRFANVLMARLPARNPRGAG